MSKTRIDRLGDRMRSAVLSPGDVRLLDQYRRSFGEPCETVVGSIRERLQLEPTARPAKSTISLVDKLRRESIRLSQVQDIAGCRVVVTDSLEQDRVVAALIQLFPGASVTDRRDKPSHGYRAVHVIAKIAGKAIEIQVRSGLQHVWAELSEKLSDVVNPSIKYGGGGDEMQYVLTYVSRHIASLARLIHERSFPDRGRQRIAEDPILRVAYFRCEAGSALFSSFRESFLVKRGDLGPSVGRSHECWGFQAGARARRWASRFQIGAAG